MRRSAPSLRDRQLCFMTAIACWAAAGSAEDHWSRIDILVCPCLFLRITSAERVAGVPFNSDEKLFFLLFARIVATGASAAPRTEQIETHLNSLHQRRRFLHRPPKIVPELRSGIFHSFERACQNSVGMHEL